MRVNGEFQKSDSLEGIYSLIIGTSQDDHRKICVVKQEKQNRL